MTERLCYNCRYCYVVDDPGYSEVTPGAGLMIRCARGHWDFGLDPTRQNLRDSMRKAVDCKDFEEP